MRRSGQDNLRAGTVRGSGDVWDEMTSAGGPEIVFCADELGPLTLRSRREICSQQART
jgi:hypothetical protein